MLVFTCDLLKNEVCVSRNLAVGNTTTEEAMPKFYLYYSRISSPLNLTILGSTMNLLRLAYVYTGFYSISSSSRAGRLSNMPILSSSLLILLLYKFRMRSLLRGLRESMCDTWLFEQYSYYRFTRDESGVRSYTRLLLMLRQTRVSKTERGCRCMILFLLRLSNSMLISSLISKSYVSLNSSSCCYLSMRLLILSIRFLESQKLAHARMRSRLTTPDLRDPAEINCELPSPSSRLSLDCIC